MMRLNFIRQAASSITRATGSIAGQGSVSNEMNQVNIILPQVYLLLVVVLGLLVPVSR
jgi:hypothetical protein